MMRSDRSLIHLLLLGTLVYQFFPAGKRVIVDGVSWYLSLLGVLNAIYIHVWVKEHYVLGEIPHIRHNELSGSCGN